MLASNNGLEWLNRELKGRCDVVQISPKDASLRLLAGAVVMEQHNDWQIARRQVSRELMGEVPTKDDAPLSMESSTRTHGRPQSPQMAVITAFVRNITNFSPPRDILKS